MDNNYKGWPHLMCSGFDCDRKLLSDIKVVYNFLNNLPEKIGMTKLGLPVIYYVDKKVHSDVGVTGTIVIATSHISIHTFPYGQKDGKRKPRGIEHRIFKPFFTFDCYSCRDFDPDVIYYALKNTFKPKHIETALLYRLRDDENLIEVEDY